MYGRSNHHKIEACFKAFARALRVACAKDRAAGEDAAEHEGAAVIALDRLRRRQPDVGAQGAGGARRRVRDAVDRRPSCATARGIIVPGVGHFDATRAIDAEWRGAIRAARRSRRARCSASASACSGCSRAAPRRLDCRASAASPGVRSAATRPSSGARRTQRAEGAARRLEQPGAAAPDAR